ncbi:Bug family tripartite tricarboxylate transporter substrate binding protein [Bordetella genomosp. 13]|uniref:Bug family tripartite tricarboxylate transporter substrate binding protein n=1 Tax=Bordetella genomosp. 13 TaxID=463040 RepID=UPI0011A9AFAA|nr:tripartite tricarboxylate transporter substrate binding protein [Bordetella genomosp. 13]
MRHIFYSGLLLACVAFAGTSPAARAADWPTRPVSVVIPFPPGGTTDVIGRLMAQKLSQRLGQPFVVENRAGASGAIGTRHALQSPPDGNTILVVTTTTFSTYPATHPKTPYKVEQDAMPVINVAEVANVLMAHPGLKIKTLPQLLDYARKHPGDLDYGTPGAGSFAHLAIELLGAKEKAQFLHIPYKGAGPALNDAMGGQIKVLFDQVPTTLAQIQAGKLVPIAVTSRQDSLPGVPTFEEQGVADYAPTIWYGLAVPAGTPPAIVDRLNREANAILTDPDVKAQLQGQGATAKGGTAQAFAAQVQADYARWSEVSRAQHLQMED